MDVVAGVATDQGDAEDLALLGGDQLAEAAGVALGDRPIILGEVEGLDADVLAKGLARLGLAETDRGQFRIAIGDARNLQGVGIDRQGEDGLSALDPGRTGRTSGSATLI